MLRRAGDGWATAVEANTLVRRAVVYVNDATMRAEEKEGSMGFNHGKKKLTGLPPSYSNALVRRYLLQYTKHRKAEKRGGVVLVWMDESYIHQGYCSKYIVP